MQNKDISEIKKRKANRLTGYNYSNMGAYYITICIKERHNILGEILGETTCHTQTAEEKPKPLPSQILLNETGKIVKTAIENVNLFYPNVIVDRYVIMPNHIHAIFVFCDNTGILEDHGRQIAAPTLSAVIGNLKRSVSIKLGYSIWQKSFHDHIIRNEQEYLSIVEYIEQNPMNWAEDVLQNLGGQ